MEQTWYLFPGQTLENTKIKDRGKALIATPEAWTKITDHLDKQRVQQEIIDEELAHRKYLKDVSRDMIKDWDNSIEKIQRRRFEDHDRKVREREENLVKRFLELRSEQQEERNKIVADAKKRMEMIKQDSRSLNSALLLSEVLYERKLQQDFDAVELKKKEVEAAKYADLVTYNALQEQIENKEKIRKRKETDVNYSKELMQQIKQIEADEKKQKEEKVNAEIEDIKRAKEEFKAIKNYEALVEQKKKADVKQQFYDFAKQQKEIKEENKKQEENVDKIIKIYARAKCKMDEMKKSKEKQSHAEKVEVREKIAAKSMAQQANFKEEEERIMANAQIEYEEKAQEVLKKKENYQHKLREERLETRRQFLKREQEEKERKKELEKWEMTNRLKNNEIMNKYDQIKAQGLFDEKMQYRKQLNQQIKDDDTREHDQKCKDQELLYYKQKKEEEDKSFFTYADEILDLAKSRGRTTEPIQKVIQNYKMENNLALKKKNISHLQTKVPINNKNK